MQASFPAFPVYWKDWLTGEGTSAMTTEQEGAFLRLLLHAWDSSPPCTLANDEVGLAFKAKLSLERWREIGPLVLAQFRIVGTRLRNRKQFAVYSELMAHRRAKSEAGKSGNAKRWGDETSSVAQRSHSDTSANRKRIAKVSPSSASPSASPSPIKTTDVLFEAEWLDYPKKVDKAKALKAWNALLKAKNDPREVAAGIHRYVAFQKSEGTEKKFYKNLATLLAKDGGWTEPWTIELRVLPQAVNGPPRFDYSNATKKFTGFTK